MAYSEEQFRQVFTVTHQDEFLRMANNAVLAEREATGTKFSVMAAQRALVESSRRNITSIYHPLLTLTECPLVVVEGTYDRFYLNQALRESGLRPRWRLVTGDDLFMPQNEIDIQEGDNNESAKVGGSALNGYFAKWGALISSRRADAPIVALRDWEDADSREMRILNTTLRSLHPFSTCLATDVRSVNKELGVSFKGIERYLPIEEILKVASPDDLGEHSRAEGGGVSVSPSYYNKTLKKAIYQHMVTSGASTGDHMVELAKWLNSMVESIMAAVPGEAFLNQ